MGSLAENLTPPYYEAILNETQAGLKDKEHVDPTDEMVTLATRQRGFLGLETGRDKKGNQITVSYWKDVDAIENWIFVGDDKINNRFGTGLAETCGIQITLVDEARHQKPGQFGGGAGNDAGVLRGVHAFVAAVISSLLGFLS